LSAILNSVAKRQRKASSVLVVGILREPKAAAAKVEGSDANMAWAQTTDPDGSWARAFPASKQPATFLIDPAGKVVWSHSGPVMGSSLADAIDKYLATGGPLRWQQLRPLAREGGPAPDFIFELEKGRVVPLRALRGASVVLVFWQSRLPYCLEELVHWERTARAGAGRGARILAISDGEDPQRAREVFKKGGFSSRLVCDPERRIGLAYGVRCWPTAIAIDRSGRVKRVQVGTTPRLDPATSTRSAP
jgi:peroxiredoxin